MDADTRGEPEKVWAQPLWARQSGESDRAFEGFCAYRDLGPSRSLAIAGQVLGKTKATLEQWSTRWAWVARCSSWDDESDRLSRERDLVERREARERMLAAHSKGGAALHEIGSRVLDRFDVSDPKSADEARARIEKLSALEAARLMEIGARLERLARDDSSRRITDPEARKFVEGLVDVSLRFIPLERQEAFLVDFEAQLGLGIGP
jgi:hypothetical protein